MIGDLATFEFPGVVSVRSASYTHAHGTSPGVFSVSCYPQAYPPSLRGNATFRQGETALVFPDCIIDKAEYTVDGSGQVIGLTIFDRRWKWQFPRISGQYNLYKENGDLDFSTEKTPQELATLLLEAMGESGASIGALPNDARPFVDWDNALAAGELESLCELLGCRIMLGPGSKVLIAKLGEGEQLPDSPDIHAGGAVLDPPEAPDEFEFVGEPDQFQFDAELEAVGIDIDRSIRLVDDLSYTPATGWDGSDLEGQLEDITDTKARNLAKATICRLYRVNIPAGGLWIPGYDKPIRYRWQLEFLNRLIATKLDNGEIVPQEPFVYGVWYDGRDKEGNVVDALLPASSSLATDYDKAAVWPHGFSFDDRNHVLHFGAQVMREDTATATDRPLKAAQLRFRCCVNIRDEDTRAYVQTKAAKATGYNNGTKPGLIVQREYVRSTYPNYANNTAFNVIGIVDSKDQFIADATYYVDKAIAALRLNNPQRLVYESIRPIHLDGAIQQVTWEVGNDATPKTTACRNNDVNDYLPGYRERRRLQKQKEIVDSFAVLRQALKLQGPIGGGPAAAGLLVKQ